MMNPARVPASSVVADLLALAEVLGVPAAKRETLALIAEQLKASQEAAVQANAKWAEADKVLKMATDAQNNVLVRERALEDRTRALADSHAELTRREAKLTSGEAELAQARTMFDELAQDVRAELDKRERAAKEITERAAGLSAEAHAVKTEYEGKLKKIKALAEG